MNRFRRLILLGAVSFISCVDPLINERFIDAEDVESIDMMVVGGPESAIAGDTLPFPVTVLITDRISGKPVKGAHLEFGEDTVSDGFVPARFLTPSAITDAEGHAASRVVFGTQAGPQFVVATVRVNRNVTQRIELGTAIAGVADTLVEVRDPRAQPFSRVLAEQGFHSISTISFEARDRFGNRINSWTGSLTCSTTSVAIAEAMQSGGSCTVSARGRGTTTFKAQSGAATFTTPVRVLPYAMESTTASQSARLAVFQSATRTLSLIKSSSGPAVIVRQVPAGGFDSDGSALRVGGLWLSSTGVAWAVGAGADSGRVQISPGPGDWQEVTLPAAMAGWVPQRVYGFGSSLVVLTATSGTAFSLWAQSSGAWANLQFPDPIQSTPLVAVESPTSIYVADPSTNRSWHWNGSMWGQIKQDSHSGQSLSLSIVSAALDGTTYGRRAVDSATTSYRLSDGIATRLPWPHNIADFGGRAVRMGTLDNPDPMLRVTSLHGWYRFVQPASCHLANAGAYADLPGITSAPDGTLWFTAARIAFASTLSGFCLFVTYLPR